MRMKILKRLVFIVIATVLVSNVTNTASLLRKAKEAFSKPVVIANDTGRPLYIALVATKNGSRYLIIEKNVGKGVTYAKILGNINESNGTGLIALYPSTAIRIPNLIYDTGYDRTLFVSASRSNLQKALEKGKMDTNLYKESAAYKVGTSTQVTIKGKQKGNDDYTFIFSTASTRFKPINDSEVTTLER